MSFKFDLFQLSPQLETQIFLSTSCVLLTVVPSSKIASTQETKVLPLQEMRPVVLPH